jgi:hypothetical protein
MKKLFWLLPLTIILSACPFESNVALEEHPVEPADSSLVGYWYGIVKDGSDFFGIEALDISRESDSVYSIIRYGKAIKGDIILPDTAYFTGFTSQVGDRKFMNVGGSVVITTPRGKKPPDVRVEKVFYLSAFTKSNDTLTIQTITESFTPTVKVFRSPAQLKQVVGDMLGKGHNIFDEQYSLSYRKIEKPKPVKPF